MAKLQSQSSTMMSPNAKLTEQALKESEKKYRELLEAAQEGIWTMDSDVKNHFCQPAHGGKFWGYTQEEITGKRIFDFMDEKGVEIAKQQLEQRRLGIKGEHDIEYIHKSGRRILCPRWISIPLYDKMGNFDGAMGVIVDITERKLAEAGAQGKRKEIPPVGGNRTGRYHADG